MPQMRINGKSINNGPPNTNSSFCPHVRPNNIVYSPTLTWSSLIAGHMASPAIQARMVDLPPPRLSRLLLSSSSSRLVLRIPSIRTLTPISTITPSTRSIRISIRRLSRR